MIGGNYIEKQILIQKNKDKNILYEDKNNYINERKKNSKRVANVEINIYLEPSDDEDDNDDEQQQLDDQKTTKIQRKDDKDKSNDVNDNLTIPYQNTSDETSSGTQNQNPRRTNFDIKKRLSFPQMLNIPNNPNVTLQNNNLQPILKDQGSKHVSSVMDTRKNKEIAPRSIFFSDLNELNESFNKNEPKISQPLIQPTLVLRELSSNNEQLSNQIPLVTQQLTTSNTEVPQIPQQIPTVISANSQNLNLNSDQQPQPIIYPETSTTIPVHGFSMSPIADLNNNPSKPSTISQQENNNRGTMDYLFKITEDLTSNENLIQSTNKKIIETNIHEPDSPLRTNFSLYSNPDKSFTTNNQGYFINTKGFQQTDTQTSDNQQRTASNTYFEKLDPPPQSHDNNSNKIKTISNSSFRYAPVQNLNLNPNLNTSTNTLNPRERLSKKIEETKQKNQLINVDSMTDRPISKITGDYSTDTMNKKKTQSMTDDSDIDRTQADKKKTLLYNLPE